MSISESARLVCAARLLRFAPWPIQSSTRYLTSDLIRDTLMKPDYQDAQEFAEIPKDIVKDARRALERHAAEQRG
jgi:hypothetical protein